MALLEVKIDTHTKEFLHQQWYVKLVGVIACKVGITDILHETWCQLLERGLISNIGIGYAMDSGGHLWDMNGIALFVDRADALDTGIGGAIGHHLVEANLDNMVVSYLDAGSLKVKEDDRFGEVKIHSVFF
jgi:hypothetical protein